MWPSITNSLSLWRLHYASGMGRTMHWMAVLCCAVMPPEKLLLDKILTIRQIGFGRNKTFRLVSPYNECALLCYGCHATVLCCCCSSEDCVYLSVGLMADMNKPPPSEPFWLFFSDSCCCCCCWVRKLLLLPIPSHASFFFTFFRDIEPRIRQVHLQSVRTQWTSSLCTH